MAHDILAMIVSMSVRLSVCLPSQLRPVDKNYYTCKVSLTIADSHLALYGCTNDSN